MTTVEIEYCVPCGLLDPAIETQTRLLDEFGQELEGVTLAPSHGGVFTVTADGETIWDRAVHGIELDLEVIVSSVDDRLSTDA
ncbi:SelT/SelW/SelH family protein [Natrinema caseinilyticum]|uniref:SelT/SelW/SelH family protein n=1 Tax=Natrinema caseinilyticum TaxID=2961570 RepID=UPI0020C57B9D|nr:Rdx family protein [Natrinema caseinilyticum]